MILFKNYFHIIWGKTVLRVIIREVWDPNDLKVWLWLGKSRFVYLKRVDIFRIFYVLVDDLKIGLLGYFISNYQNSKKIWMNIVNQNLWFGVLKKSVDICYMSSQVSYKGVIVDAYCDDNLFSRRFFYSHLDAWFWFQIALDDVVDLVNFLHIKSREQFFDFEYLRSVHILLWYLSIGLIWFLGFHWCYHK